MTTATESGPAANSASTSGHSRNNAPISVKPSQRFTHDHRCPICDGSDDDRRGQGERCFGYLSSDGQWANCTREEYAGSTPFDAFTRTFKHRLKGPCPCGKEHAPADPKDETVYRYLDADGHLLFEVVRTFPKRFHQRRPDGRGGYIWNLKGVKRVPYRLPELVKADHAAPVFIVEGEKDVDNLIARGIVATCNPMGAGKWFDIYSEHLAGRHVVILPDNDSPGHDHGQQVARSLQGNAASVKVLDLPGLPEHGDVSDWLAKGGTADTLRALVQEAPPWTPQPRGKPGDSSGNGQHDPPAATRQKADPHEWIDKGEIADLGDVRRAIGELSYTWRGWIQPGTITTLAAEPGTGKTLVCLKLCQIVWNHLPMPDGSENLLAAERTSLWLCYDRAWGGIMRAASKLGLPDEAIRLPTWKGQPLSVPDLDDPRTIILLERIIRKLNPWCLFIDTMTYATGANVALAHEAKFAYSPLMGVMAELGGCCISNTHLSTGGGVLNRRPRELSRTVLKLKSPDPQNPNRLRFWVDKTDDERPEPLGVTIGGGELVAFDDAPPLEVDDQPRRGGRPATVSPGFSEWLHGFLEPGPMAMAALIDAARDAGLMASPDAKNPKPSISPLYNARDRIRRAYPGWRIHEFTVKSATGRELKHWELTNRPEGEGDDTNVPF